MIMYNYPGQRAKNNYSNEEKLGMIQEYLTTPVSMEYMCNKYHIGHSTIPRWMSIFGIAMPNQAPSQVTMPQNQKMQETPVSTESLEAKLKDLQAELDREKLKNLALTTMIEVAEEELHIDIRKKAGTKQ